jgi:hypothetical protein
MQRLVLLALACIWGIAGAQPINSRPTGESGSAARFLGALELASLRSGVRVVQAEGRITAQHVACVDAHPTDLFHPVAQRFVERELSAEEQATADAFFAGPLGRKLLGFVVAAGEAGLPVNLASLLADINAEEQSLAQAFLDSSAGDKILIKSLFRKGAARQEVVAKGREVLRSCMRARQ